MLPDPEKRRTPGTGTPGLDKLDESNPSVVEACDAAATLVDAGALARHRRRVDHELELVDRLCPQCQARIADPDLDSCHGCARIGADSVKSAEAAP